MNKKYTIPALEKAICLLEYLGQEGVAGSHTDLAKQLDIPVSTCYRILRTLEKADWVRKSDGNCYDLSSGMLCAVMKLTNQVSRFQSLEPLLEQLSVQTGLSCKLSIRQGEQQVAILRAESPRPMSVSGKVGGRFPIVEGSVGAALLFNVAKDDIAKLAGTSKEDILEKQHPGIIYERIEAIRTQGYCLNMKDNRWKIDAMSVPVLDSGEMVVGALTLLGFDDDFQEDNLYKLSDHLKAIVAKCGRLI